MTGMWRRLAPTLWAALPLEELRRTGEAQAVRVAEWVAGRLPGAVCAVCGGREDVVDVAGYRLCRNCRQGIAAVGGADAGEPG